MAFKVIVADDEEPICNLLCSMLDEFDAFSVVASTTSSGEILGLLEQHHPDILFLDIFMPDIDGLTICHRIAQDYPDVFTVFVTAHTHFAAEAYNMGVVDYIVKPFDKNRIAQALERIVKFHTSNLCVNNTNDSRNKLALKIGHGVTLIDVNNILFIEKSGHKCLIHTSSEKYETRESLSSLEKKLDGMKNFFRCHKSFIINVDRVEKILPYADRAYGVVFYNYPDTANMRREKFEEFAVLMNIE